MGIAPAPFEGLQIGCNADPVQLDRPPQRGTAERHPALLPGIAQQQRIAVQRVAHQCQSHGLGIDEQNVALAGRLENIALELLRGQLQVRIAQEFRGGQHVIVDHGAGHLRTHLGQRFVACRDDQVAAQQQIGLAGGDAGGMQMGRIIGDLDMRKDRAALLSKPGHVQHRDALAFEVGRHPQQLSDRHHPGAADAGHENAVGSIARFADRDRGRVGQRRGSVCRRTRLQGTGAQGTWAQGTG